MIETRGLRKVFANHLGENVVAALTALGLAWSTRLFTRSLR
jgi:hypothetical protein